MDLEKQILIVRGTVKHIPGVKRFLSKRQIHVGTTESRYCYTVWLRHLSFWYKHKKTIPNTVAELGPGDTLGTGFAALLSGSNHLFALDVEKKWNNEENLRIFDELVLLFRNRAPIPDPSEYPKVRPQIVNYEFPSYLTGEVLSHSLSNDRIEAIRKEIMDIDNPSNEFVKYQIPWNHTSVIKQNSIDFIYSQAVLECVEDLEGTYAAMHSWLKPGGMMSHTIDFRSHGLTREWNGHLKFSELEWQLVKGGKKYLLNRHRVSGHICLHKKHGFNICERQTVLSKNNLEIKKLPGKFRHLTEEDLSTSGVYILSCRLADSQRKPGF